MIGYCAAAAADSAMGGFFFDTLPWVDLATALLLRRIHPQSMAEEASPAPAAMGEASLAPLLGMRPAVAALFLLHLGVHQVGIQSGKTLSKLFSSQSYL